MGEMTVTVPGWFLVLMTIGLWASIGLKLVEVYYNHQIKKLKVNDE